MIGRVFNNRYQITELIGIGGMAEVYRAQDTVLGRTVAIKVMLPQYAADPTFAQRFKQEAASAANLQSPYIVNIYDWGQDDGTYYIVMEYVRGSDLKTGIKQRGAINQRKVAEIGSQVCRALSVAHQQDIIHRDIKPQNIMVQPDGNIKVMDFGIARAKNSVRTQTSSVLGTAHYISPEQAQGKELTAASDIYSLGIVLYEAATGQLPFDGPDAVSVALKQVNELPLPPRQINPDIDPSLEAIIMKAIEKDPRARFATANDMRLELNNFLAGRSVGIARDSFGSDRTAVMGGVAGGGAMGGLNARNDGTEVMPSGMGSVKPVNASGSSYRQSNHPESKGASKRGIIIAIVAVVAVIAIGLGVFFALSGGQEEGVEVPNVVGQQYEQAKATLEAAGFKVTTDSVHDDSAPENSVVSQDPKAGETHPAGTRVTLTVSLGANETKVPNVVGMTPEEAQHEIEAAGLKFTQGSGEYSKDTAEGRVARQSPAAGETVTNGATVTYYLSLGAEKSAVPSVVGLSESNATSMLRNAGFNVNVLREQSSESAGIVIRQDPAGESSQAPGTTITIVVSSGPGETSVPNVVGQTLSLAITNLQAAGFSYYIEGTDDPNGIVTSQSATTAAPGSTITLVVEAPAPPANASE